MLCRNGKPSPLPCLPDTKGSGNSVRRVTNKTSISVARDHEVNKRVKAVCEISGIILGISSAIYLLVWGARVPLVGIRNILVQRRHG